MEGGAPPSIETVCAAIASLYHNPDPKEKERASTWLQALQKSVFAWKVRVFRIVVRIEPEFTSIRYYLYLIIFLNQVLVKSHLHYLLGGRRVAS